MKFGLRLLPFVLRNQQRDARLRLYGTQAAWRTRRIEVQATDLDRVHDENVMKAHYPERSWK